MKLAEKIVSLRKNKGLSQEQLAEKLNVSRQAVSRWEMGTALPDASNLLQLSKLFETSTDYLLDDAYENKMSYALISHQNEFFLQIFLQALCVFIHIIMCFINIFPFLSILSLGLNLFLMVRFNKEIQQYEIISDIIKKYYVNIYIIVIWFMQYISILRWRILEKITDFCIEELTTPVFLFCVISIIFSIKHIKKKG